MFIGFRERGRERERNSNVRNVNQLPPACALTRDGTHNLLVVGTLLQPTEPPGQGSRHILKDTQRNREEAMEKCVASNSTVTYN